MKKVIRTGGLGIGAVVMVLTSASAAYAAGTYVSVNGSTTIGTVAYTATNDTPSVAFMTNYGVKMSCTSTLISGNITRGMEVTPSNVLATVGNLAFDGCTMGPFDVDVTMTGGDIEVLADPAGPGADVPVRITNIHADISGGSCVFEADGTLDAVLKAGSGGRDATLELISATFDAFGNPISGFGLTISSVSGCGGEIVNGDLAGAWDSDKVSSIPSIFEANTTGVVTHS